MVAATVVEGKYSEVMSSRGCAVANDVILRCKKCAAGSDRMGPFFCRMIKVTSCSLLDEASGSDCATCFLTECEGKLLGQGNGSHKVGLRANSVGCVLCGGAGVTT